MNTVLVHEMIASRAEMYYGNTAFIDRSGRSYSYGELLIDASAFSSAVNARSLAGRPAAVIGEVTYGSLAAMLGCMKAGCPIVPLSQSLGIDELCALMTEYEIGVLIYSEGCGETAEILTGRLSGLTALPDDKQALGSPAELAETAETANMNADPMSPAFLFSAADGGGILLSHKNICGCVEAIASVRDISSYTFLSPSVWGGAFDCTAGLLLPLYAGCALVQRGEKRGAAKAISESGATALTCTPQRLRSLERSLRIRSEKKRGSLGTAVYSLFGRLGSLLSPDLGKRMHRRVHKLLGDNLRLIICGGPWPEQNAARKFTEWGIEVCSYYFTAECGALAVYDGAMKRLSPLAPLSVPSPIKGGSGELCLSGDRVPIGYFGGRTDFDGSFPTGDVGLVTDDGYLELRGRKKTMLYGKDGELIFPEELIAVMRKNRYITDCSITGRYDTRTADVIITAHITPDFKEIGEAMGEKYSANRLKLFFNHIMDKMADELPHKVHEFTLPD